MSDVYERIRQERIRQDAKWGGPEHDDQHDRLDWITYIAHHNDACYYANFVTAMIETAALAVAAIESFERKNETPAAIDAQKGGGE